MGLVDCPGNCCAGLHAMMALRAGAEHVTAVDRWLYMALACKESLVRVLNYFRRFPLISSTLRRGSSTSPLQSSTESFVR